MTHSKTISEFPAATGEWRNPASVHRRPLAILSSGILLGLIQIYRYTVSPASLFLFGADNGCRFTPTCSQYAREAIQEHGAMTGSKLALRRICRCHPLGGCGHDPVPASPTTGHLNAR